MTETADTVIRTEFITANGIDFETDICGDGERFALLLHGFPESKFSWRYQMPLLARLGYTVWAPNMRGYGETTRPRGRKAYRMDVLLDDVGALIDKGSGGRKPVLLMAHDWGGIVAWTAAAGRLRPLHRLIVMNLPHPAKMFKGLRTWRQLKKSWYIFFFQLPWLPERAFGRNDAEAVARVFRDMAVDKSRFSEDVLRHYRDNALKPGALKAMINYYRAGFGSSEFRKRWEDPPLIHTPTLMIWGEEDAALGKELTYGTEALVPDLTLRYLPEVSHWVQQEAPEAVNAMIEAWLKDEPVPYAGPRGRLLSPEEKDRAPTGSARAQASEAAKAPGAR